MINKQCKLVVIVGVLVNRGPLDWPIVLLDFLLVTLSSDRTSLILSKYT